MNNTVRLFGMTLHGLSMKEAVDILLDWATKHDGRCRYVVTPNVDHAVLFQEHRKLREAYADASLVLVDGFPVMIAARLLGHTIPERVPGSDLVPALFDATTTRKRTLRVFLLGAAEGVGEQAAVHIQQRWPSVRVVGTYSPPFMFENSEIENMKILERVHGTRPDVLIVGLGAPKQELWVHAHHARLETPVVLCVGATIDFLAGEKARAPIWMRLIGLEWLHRLASEPQRLGKRYVRDAWIFPRLVWRELISNPRTFRPPG